MASGVFDWLASLPSLLFGQNEPKGTKSATGKSQGEDIPLALGTPLGNILPGKVVRANYAPWGGQVDIETLVNGVPTVEEYLHLDTIAVKLGQVVNIGDLIGTYGGQLSGGQHPSSPLFSTGPHIKYSLFQGASDAQVAAGKWGKAIDPSAILASAKAAFGGLSKPGSGGTGGVYTGGFGTIVSIISGLASGTIDAATGQAELFGRVVQFFTSADFAKVGFGVMLVSLALFLFIQPQAQRVATQAAPFVALAA